MSSGSGNIGLWELHRSSRTGSEYFYNTRTKASLWRDPELPRGWAWSRTSDAAPKLYTCLISGATQFTLPLVAVAVAIAVAAADIDVDAVRVAKRARTGTTVSEDYNVVAAANTATTTTNTTTTTTVGMLDPSCPPPRPTTRIDDKGGLCVMGFCAEAPPCLARVQAAAARAAAASVVGVGGVGVGTAGALGAGIGGVGGVAGVGSFFGNEHALILRQLVRTAVGRHAAEGAAMAKALETRGRDASEALSEAAARTLVLVDIGAGAGVSTALMLEAGGTAAQVFSIDFWDNGQNFYADTLGSYGHTALSAAWAAGDVGSDVAASAPARAADADTLFALFCARFWESQDRLVPVRAGASAGVVAIDRMGLAPSLVWLDADLTPLGARATLDALWARWLDPVVCAQGGTVGGGPPRAAPLVGGGGWDLSEGVRSAITAFAAAHALPLHVEQGKAWTLTPEAVRETRNDPIAFATSSVTNEAAAAGAALRVSDVTVERDAVLRVWQAGVIRALDAPGEDVARLRVALADGGDPDGEVLIKGGACVSFLNAGCNDKRHSTLLMHATKAGKSLLVAALLGAGAGVNVQAARSAQTALHLAAYEGHTAAAAILLGAGADADLVNKWGETARGLAGKKCHVAVTALINKNANSQGT